MKNCIAFVVLLALALPAAAQDRVFQTPDGELIKLTGAECPAGVRCVPSLSQQIAGVEVNLMLPEWSASEERVAFPDNQEENAYLKGLSDSTIIDNCNTCDCCLIYKKPRLAADFERWDTSRFGGATVAPQINAIGRVKQ